jgi:hypothetical protein
MFTDFLNGKTKHPPKTRRAGSEFADYLRQTLKKEEGKSKKRFTEYSEMNTKAHRGFE